MLRKDFIGVNAIFGLVAEPPWLYIGPFSNLRKHGGFGPGNLMSTCRW
jgi:hypothetical protein